MVGGLIACEYIIIHCSLSSMDSTFAVRKSKVTSKKPVIHQLHCTVMFNPCCLKTGQSCFFVFSDLLLEKLCKQLSDFFTKQFYYN